MSNKRANLMRADDVKPAVSFHALLREVLQVRAQRTDAERLERQKMNGPAAVAMACKAAGCDEARLVQLEEQLQSLPADAPEYAPAFRFVGSIKDRAAGLPGDLCPPRSNLTHADLYASLAVSCLNLRCSPLELTALGWLQATREHPEVFAQGCDDPALHEQLIRSLREQERQLINDASHSWTIGDLEFELRGNGHASVWYGISKQQIGATAPDDPRGVGALVSWLEEHAEELEKL